MDARLLGNSSPRFAKMLGWKYAQMGAERVEEDLRENHGRLVSSHYVQSQSARLGEVMRHREQEWTYSLGDLEGEEVLSVGVGRDGATVRIHKEGYRVNMAGTLSLYGKEGKRLKTIYLGCAPQKKKVCFEALLERELSLLKERFPQARYVGLGDGAADNWTFLEPLTDVCILDFYHAAEYVKRFSECLGGSPEKRTAFWEGQRHTLRHEAGGAQQVLDAMRAKRASIRAKDKAEKANASITYFENHIHQMDYAAFSELGYPIGSGVTEAACKTLIKQRLCQSGMKWTLPSVDDVLLARGLILSDGRWNQFWKKVDRHGYYA
jgi:hypothetical protein